MSQYNTIKLKGLVKLIKPNQYIGISDWHGQFAFISWKYIIKTYPQQHTLQQWQEAYFILTNDAKVNWKDDNPQYFNQYEFKEKTIPAPQPIPQEFLDNQPQVQQYIQKTIPQTPQQPQIQQNTQYGMQLPTIPSQPITQKVSSNNNNSQISGILSIIKTILIDIRTFESENNILLRNLVDFLTRDYKPEFIDESPQTNADDSDRLPSVRF